MGSFFSSLFGNSVRIVTGIVVAVIAVFLYQSWRSLSQQVELKLFTAYSLPMWGWMLVMFVLGCLFWIIVSHNPRAELKRELKRSRLAQKDLKSELDRLRNQSLKDPLPAGDDPGEAS